MAVAYLNELTLLSGILILGILGAIIAQKVRLPDVLLLIIIGLAIGQFSSIGFNESFLTSFSIFALILIIFDSTARFNPKEVYALSPYAMKLAGVFLLVNMVILTVATLAIFYFDMSFRFVLLSALFAAIMSGTAPEAVLSLLKDKKSKIASIIEFESIINTPMIVIIALIILNFYMGTEQSVAIITVTFLKEIMTGMGTGLVIGLILFSIMKKYYSESLSSLVLIATALITYTLASQIGGNGVLAVTTLGVMYGLMRVKEKQELEKFSSLFTNFVRIVVFVLLGMIIIDKVSLSIIFIIKSIVLFIVYLISRYISVAITFREYNVTKKEKLFMTLTASKGVAVVVVALIIATELGYENISVIINLISMFILYSLATSSVAVKFSDYFLGKNKKIKSAKQTND